MKTEEWAAMWRRVPKESNSQPASGTYADWKPILAEEATFRCVYCGVHEADIGGVRMFHVEHFRPKSKFPDLTNDIKNLYFACPICNTFKSDDWPHEPEQSSPSYLDPSFVDLGTVFVVGSDLIVTSASVSGRYMVERLGLNRAQLVLVRRSTAVRYRIARLRSFAQSLLPRLRGGPDDKVEMTIAFIRALFVAEGRMDDVLHSRPYEPGDDQRP